jgi:hypothetical protein
MEGLNEAVDIIKENAPPIVEREERSGDYYSENKGADINFDDLGK